MPRKSVQRVDRNNGRTASYRRRMDDVKGAKTAPNGPHEGRKKHYDTSKRAQTKQLIRKGEIGWWD